MLFLFAVGSMLPGCPIYGDDQGCSVDDDCPDDYACDDLVGSCRPNSCTAPTQCPSNQTCSRDGKCVVGDCSWADIGCVTGYACSSVSGVYECVRGSSTSTGDGGAGGAAAGSGGVSSGGSESSSGGANNVSGAGG
ncbi:MAG: hypothetical protein QM756_06655 [Polyangiaceae bacterium]